jgi:hypothetical protein
MFLQNFIQRFPRIRRDAEVEVAQPQSPLPVRGATAPVVTSQCGFTHVFLKPAGDFDLLKWLRIWQLTVSGQAENLVQY